MSNASVLLMTAPSPHVRLAEIFRGGIVITFSDGKSAFFSAELLYSSFSQAQELTEDDEEDTATH